jgi:O-antigen ligase
LKKAMLYLLIGYMWLFVHRPFEFWPVLGSFRLELVYMSVTGLCWVAYGNKRWPANRLHLAILAFTGAVLACWVASPWVSANSSLVVENHLKLLVFYFLLVTCLRDERDLTRLVQAFVVVMAVYMLHSLWEYRNGRHVYRMSISRMVGVDESLGDPNSFGASILYALPLATLFWGLSEPGGRRTALVRWLLAAYVGLSALCIVLTGSRSAFVGLIAWAGFTVLLSRHRWRLAAAALVLAPALWLLLPAEKQTRFLTLIDPEVGPANAQTSAEGRIEGLKIGLALWNDNPVTGCGPGAWLVATGSEIESHNLYGQVLGELGTLGAVTFAAVVLCLWWNLRCIRAAYRDRPEWGDDFCSRLARAIGLSLGLMLLEGFAGHNLWRHNWYWFGAFLVVAHHLVAERLHQEEPYSAGERATDLTPVGEQQTWIGMPV